MCHCHTFPERFSPKLIKGLSTTTRTRTTVVMDGEMCRPSAGHGTRVGAELATRRCSAAASGAHAARVFGSEWERKAFAFLTDTARQVDADAAEFVSPRVRVALSDEEPSDVQLCSGGKAWLQGSIAQISTTLEEERCQKVFSPTLSKNYFNLKKCLIVLQMKCLKLNYFNNKKNA